MNKNSFENLMKDYCSVTPPYEFEVSLEENTMKTKTKIFMSLACAALVLVCAVAFIAGFGKDFVPKDKIEDFGFIVNAHAEGTEKDIATLSEENTKICKEYPLINKDMEKVKALSVDHIALELTGEDVAGYDVKAQYGTLHFRDELHRLGAENVNAGGRVFDYFVCGSELYNLPVDSDETYLFWLPGFDRIDADAPTFKKQCEILQTGEDYNKYFGDIITITVEYKDGTKKSVDIEISFDDEAYVYAKMTANENITMY